MKKIILIMFFLISVSENYSQSITNTLGDGGQFIIRDGSTIYLSMSQPFGHLSLGKSIFLPSTTDHTTGIIYKGATRFIHNYAPPGASGYNTFLGVGSGNFTMTAPISSNSSYNTAVGYSSITNNTTGYGNSALGVASLANNSTGYYNTALGMNSMVSNNTGYRNTAIGMQSLYGNTSGNGNTAVGYQSSYFNSTGIENTAVGQQSLFNNQGSKNTAVGHFSLFSNTTGNPNTALGSLSLYLNSSGFENTALGYRSLYSNTTGWQNTAVGDSALFSNIGNYNTALGYGAGSTVTTGYNLTLLGIGAIPSSPTAGDEITLGNIWVQTLRCNTSTITSLSDKRDKKNITNLSLGLDFILKLQPRQYNWDKRDWYDDGNSDGSKMEEKPTAGFIAQELDSLQIAENVEWLDLVLKNNPEKWEATPGNLFPVIVKAIQELKQENDELKSEIEKLKNEQLAEIQSLKDELIEQIKLMIVQDVDSDIKFSSAGN